MSANVMTREQKLYAMRMIDLVEVAEKLGVKIDKKGKKSTAVLKILDAENNKAGDGTPLAEVGKEIAEQAKQKAEETQKAIEKVKSMSTDEVVTMVEKVKTKNKSANKSTKKTDAKPKKERTKINNFDESINELNELLKNTRFEISDVKTSGRYKYITDKNVKGSTMLVYLGKKKITLLLTNNQSVDSIKPSRLRNTRYSKAYDIECSNKKKLVDYLNKVIYTKSKKGDK